MATDPVLALDAARTLAHDSPAGRDWWTVWHTVPELLLPVALGAFLYLRGLRRWRELAGLLARARPRHLAMLARWLVYRGKAGAR